MSELCWPVVEIKKLKCRLGNNENTTLTYWGQVTSSITWSFDLRCSTSYGWSTVTMCLFGNFTEIWSLKYWTHRRGHGKKERKRGKKGGGGEVKGKGKWKRRGRERKMGRKKKKGKGKGKEKKKEKGKGKKKRVGKGKKKRKKKGKEKGRKKAEGEREGSEWVVS